MWVIPVLLAATVVTAGRLQMAVRPRTDPDIAPGRWNRQGADACERDFVAHPLTTGIDVTEAALGRLPGDARVGVRRIAEPGRAGDLLRPVRTALIRRQGLGQPVDAKQGR